MPEELTLVPCPACGNPNVVVNVTTRAAVHCPDCGMYGPCAPTFSKKYAIRQWNALPRALEWTDEPPKVPGWYWFKTAYRTHIVSVEPDPRKVDDLYICVGGVGNWMSKLHGQWAGPIPEPANRRTSHGIETVDAWNSQAGQSTSKPLAALPPGRCRPSDWRRHCGCGDSVHAEPITQLPR